MLPENQDLPCVDPGACRLRMVFDEVDEMVRSTFSSITLETLVSGGTIPELEAPPPPRRVRRTRRPLDAG